MEPSRSLSAPTFRSASDDFDLISTRLISSWAVSEVFTVDIVEFSAHVKKYCVRLALLETICKIEVAVIVIQSTHIAVDEESDGRILESK